MVISYLFAVMTSNRRREWDMAPTVTSNYVARVSNETVNTEEGLFCWGKKKRNMPKVKRSRKPPPDGWELIEPTLDELDQKMREGKSVEN